ncbi:MAG: transcription termination factor NusA [Bacteroidetes bacterium]|nr:transcription termination factor NusA [Bacteroidota bacterium]MDA0942932.1 transcription termination factor NusA [Bacteroidota bacterium]MDA1110990.1 transcription termination factor NusA [Bacteroidota bacterium]
MKAKAQDLGMNLVDSFTEFKEFKNIDRATMMRVLEDVFRNILRKKFGNDANFDIIINTETGDIEMYHLRLIVEEGEVEDFNLQITLADAQKFEPDYAVGEDCIQQVFLEDFGRRAVLNARQALMSRIIELEKDELVKKYKDRRGEIITGEVYNVWKREIMVLDDEGNELTLPKEHMIPRDIYKKGDSIRAIVHDVDIEKATPRIILSRTSPEFLERLFELEVPEILDGLITIKKVVREPGERAKVAVESYDDRIDPVGACVGVKGARIHGIVRELRNENIDVISYTSNNALFIQRALQPAAISRMEIKDEEGVVNVFLETDQVSLAIGRGGHNIKLAGKLCGYQIEVYRVNAEIQEEDDVDLDEFTDEIESWIIEELKKIGLDTAKDVLRHSVEDLARRTELEVETIEEVQKILKTEFE